MAFIFASLALKGLYLILGRQRWLPRDEGMVNTLNNLQIMAAQAPSDKTPSGLRKHIYDILTSLA
jgi:hypothetical protein